MTGPLIEEQPTERRILESERTFKLNPEGFASPGSKELPGELPFGARLSLAWGSKIEHYNNYICHNHVMEYHSGWVVEGFSVTLCSPLEVDAKGAEFTQYQVMVQVVVSGNIRSDSGWNDCHRRGNLTIIEQHSLAGSVDGTIELKISIRQEISERAASIFFASPAQGRQFALAQQNLSSHTINDLAFVLYRRAPAHTGDYESVGKIYAGKALLAEVSEHFTMYDRFDAKNQVPTSMPHFQDCDPDGDADFDHLEGDSDPLSSPKQDDHETISGFSYPTHDSPTPGIALYKITESNVREQGTRFRAFVYWVYTGHITFTPLNAAVSALAPEIYQSDISSLPEPVSCKSMYRLSEKYEVKPLNVLSLRHYESQLTQWNFMAEVFTHFASTYREVQKILTKYLRKNIETHYKQLHHALSVMDEDDAMRTRWVLLAIFKCDLRNSAVEIRDDSDSEDTIPGTPRGVSNTF